MKKVLRKRNNKLTSVYAWAVEYSLKQAKERQACQKKTGLPKTTPKLK